MSVLDFLGKEILYFDGAMGTRLQAAGLKPGELPEVWNITHGDVVAEIHASYVRAGANILKSNTFGANALKMQGSGYSVEDRTWCWQLLKMQELPLPGCPKNATAGEGIRLL